MKRTAFITGASRGIGRAIAEMLAAHDYILCAKITEMNYTG